MPPGLSLARRNLTQTETSILTFNQLPENNKYYSIVIKAVLSVIFSLFKTQTNLKHG